MLTRFIKNILFLVNIAFGVGMGASLLSGHISPEVLPWLSLFAHVFSWMLFLNIGFVIFWFFFDKRKMLFSVLVIILSIPLVSDTINLLPAKVINTEKHFKIMTYNTKLFGLYNWKNNKQIRDEIFSFIREEKPDIACFQEFFDGSGTGFAVHDSLIKNQSFRYSHVYYNVHKANSQKFGIATYSNFPIINRDVLQFHNTSNIVIISDIVINKDTIRIFNCHLESVRFRKPDYNFIDSLPLAESRVREGVMGVSSRLSKSAIKRSQETDIIKKEIKASPYNVIICGDFNDTPASYTYQILSNSLSDSFKKQGVGFNGTYPMFYPPLRIDYILYDKGVECTKSYVKKVDYSDHYPVLGEYVVKQP